MQSATRLVILAALVAPNLGMADTVVLSPLLAKSGAKEQQVSNVTSLISSELDFMPEFDEVVEITKAPSSTSCLGSTSCLRTLANTGGGDAIVAGSLSATSTQFTIDLVFYDNSSGKIVRRKTFSLASDPESVADGMNDVVTEIVTGRTRSQAKAEDKAVGDDFEFDLGDDEDDGFAFEEDEFDDFDPEEELRRAQEAEKRRAEEAKRQTALRREEERRRLEEERRREAAEEARQQAEADARARAEEEARRRADEQRRREEAKQAEYDRNTEAVFDPSAISFGKPDDDDITLEALDSAINFKAPVYEEDVHIEGGGRSDDWDSEPDYGDFYGDEPDDLDDLDSGDLDAGSSRPSRPTKTPKERTGGSNSSQRIAPDTDVPAVQITLRAGYAKYYVLDFITYGGEVTIPVSDTGLNLVAGVEAYSTQREIPEELWPVLGRVAEWNTIFPLSGGLQYKFWSDGGVTPYVKADVIAAQYFVNEQNQPSWSLGARGRAGLDIAITEQVGINMNASFGAWQGADWVIIEEGMGNSGTLPQISAGTVFSF